MQLAVLDGYTILKTLHVLLVVAWVGGALTLNILATRTVRSGDDARVVAMARDTAWIGTRVFAPTSILVLVFGVLTVLSGGYSFATPWILIGLIGIGITVITGSMFLGPENRRLAAMGGEGGGADQEFRRRMSRVLAIARIDLVVLALVIVDMVVKPGA